MASKCVSCGVRTLRRRRRDGGRPARTAAPRPPKLPAPPERLRGVALEQADALELIPRWDQPHTLIYVDPPYTGPLRLAPDTRYRVGDDGALWDRLGDVLVAVRRTAVILSGTRASRAERLGWRRVALRAIRHVQARGARTRRAAPRGRLAEPGGAGAGTEFDPAGRRAFRGVVAERTLRLAA